MLEIAGVLLVKLAMLLSAKFWVYLDAIEHGNNFRTIFHMFY